MTPAPSSCPRCHTRLFRDTDPDYGFCLHHGAQYLGVPMDEPEASRRPVKMVGEVTRAEKRRTKQCIGCGKAVSENATRCVKCNHVYSKGKPHATGPRFTLTPRDRTYVTARRGTAL